MENPREIMTQYGYHEYIQQVMNLKDALFYFINNADDYHLDDELDAIYALQDVVDNTLGIYLP